MNSIINNKVLLPVLMCCFASLDLLGMNLHYQQDTDNTQQSVQLKPLTLDNLIDTIVRCKVKGGVLVGDCLITAIEGDFRRIQVIDINTAIVNKVNKSIPLKKVLNNSIFELLLNRGRLTGDLSVLYESIPPDDNTYYAMGIQNINQIIKDNNCLLENTASLIKSFINDPRSNKREMLSLKKEKIRSDEEIWFAYFFYAALSSPLDYDRYFSCWSD